MPTSRRALVAQIRHPTPDRDGGSSRTLDLIEALQASGFQVTFCAVAPEPGWERYARPLEQAGVEVRNGLDTVCDDIRAGAFEVAAMMYWQTAELVAPVVAELAPETAIVVHSGDLHFLRQARRARAAGAMLDEEAVGDYGREVNAYLLADRVITVSDDEARLAGRLLGDDRRFVVCPLSEPVLGPPLPLSERRGLLFLGNFRHVPNLEAALYLCDVVLPYVDPVVLQRHPLTVVGGGLDEPWYAEVKASVGRFPGVRLAGWVPDLHPYLRRARVSVAPLLHGAGVKGKILAALAAGTPVVTTPVGAEGIDAGTAAGLSVADGPFELAAAIERLLTDDDHWRVTAAPGPPAVARTHAREVVLGRLRQIVDDALDAVATRARGGTLTSFAAGAHQQWERMERDVVARLAAAVEAVTAPDGEVLVVAGGDVRLLDVPGRRTRHFPAADDGGPTGFHPVDGDAAVTHLRALIDRGARFLVVPAPSLYWLHHYPELTTFLEDGGGVCVMRTELGRVYRLPPIAPWHGRIVAAVPDDVASRLAAAPPVTCEVETRPWTGTAPLPFADVDGSALVVAVRPGTELPAGFWDALAQHAADLPFDIFQPAFSIGTGGPPAYEAQGGVLAREMELLTGAPVLAARAGCAQWLEEVWAGGSPPGNLRTAVLDAVPIASRAADRHGLGAVAGGRLDALASRSAGVQSVPRREPPPQLSVVIATYRRRDLLAQCLDSFVTQDMPGGAFELVVVDDGSGDGATIDVVRRYEDRLQITALTIDHAGRAAAKNVGILAAQADLVLLFDDDDIATPDLVARHLAAHGSHPAQELAVLGRTTWAPALEVSPVMHFVTDVGMLLFSYPKIAAGELLDFRYFWEGRVSCKRSFLLTNGLHDQRLEYTIDIELAHRLDAAGLKVVYVPEALSHMVRPVTVADFAERCRAKGRAARQFSQLHPSPEVRAYCRIDEAEEGYPRLAGSLEADLETVEALEASAGPVRADLDRAYERVFRAHTYKGIMEAAARQPGSPQVSVVVAVWSVTPDLAAVAYRTVERVLRVARLRTEVIVVDNGSPHPRDLPATTVVRWPQNRGVAAAWNAGLRAARGEVLVVLNSDVVVEAGWDEALVEAATTGRRICFPYTDHCDGLGLRRPDKAGTAGWCFAMAREVFDELGLFDEQFSPAYWEDTDYWHRAHAADVSLTPVPGARVQHARRTTARYLEGFETLFEDNRRRYERKHGLGFDEPPPYWHRAIEDYTGG